ncbi:hypothetical protein [Kitasatospora griseola]|uniref:hypothetical protein n=1 Tax=Kitasatospora griseola TaxID=2064 RepID=UPI000A4DA504|nr:hypothetical protein [Kitasatospora griseola]
MQRTVIVVTGGAVALFAGVLSFLTWDQANKVSGVVSALVAIAALGAAVAALVPARRPQPGRIEVANTGAAIATGGGSIANTGHQGDGSVPAAGQVRVTGTGEARAEDGGVANSGHRQG